MFAKVGPYREQVTGTVSGTRMTLEARRDGAAGDSRTFTLDRVLAKRAAAARTASPPAASAIDGKWVSVGRVAQQNVTLKVRDNKISGVICGPCDDPDGVFLMRTASWKATPSASTSTTSTHR